MDDIQPVATQARAILQAIAILKGVGIDADLDCDMVPLADSEVFRLRLLLLPMEDTPANREAVISSAVTMG